MQKVKCYACGKSYDYDEDGFCPYCGGFNQPRHARAISADGRQNPFMMQELPWLMAHFDRVMMVSYYGVRTMMPGDERTIRLEFVSELPQERVRIVVDSWTSERMEVN